MKHNSGGTCRTTLLLFLVFVVLISSSTARNLITKPTESVLSEVGVKYIEGIDGHAASSTDQSIDFSDLLGSEREECEEKDEDCVKRRMVAEAHLDYIYTQHHKQP